MGMFSNLSSEGLEATEDRVGGRRIFDTDVYMAKVKVAYAGKSAGGAQSVTVVADINGQEHRETIYITKKTGENYYTKDGKKFPLPGFSTIDDLCLLATEKGLAQQETATKMLKIYNYEQRKELPTEVETLPGLEGAEVAVSLAKVTKDKTQLNGNGQRVPTGETFDTNEIEKFMHPETKRTVNEYRAGIETSTYHDDFVKIRKGKVKNDAKGANNGNAGPGQTGMGMPGAGGNPGGAAQRLFG